MNIPPEPRWYAGIPFRSSLETDWACSLDYLGIKWKYEERGIQLPSGDGYVPDFWLPEIGTFLEVKGEGVPGKWKARDLAEMVTCKCPGPCQCQWPGGQLVLIGGPHVGLTLNWEDPLNRNTPLAQCRRCSAWCWVRLRDSLTCRKCGARLTGHLHAPGEVATRLADHHDWTEVR